MSWVSGARVTALGSVVPSPAVLGLVAPAPVVPVRWCSGWWTGRGVAAGWVGGLVRGEVGWGVVVGLWVTGGGATVRLVGVAG
ncbi:hypothetical protein N8J89_12395 [Crossiella sp. CA-258035]|uniref:hypothetical protein n=1 Tax=Crossiella sp. CA-258035 TaxID=2981138 RepID=UPI0024BC05EE|nr:hypothetical protein [Crossiella sp. CA-258035]WHT21821.1 hypothetical protein N8J89_12395 [Crossiella sp. CA-258035]